MARLPFGLQELLFPDQSNGASMFIAPRPPGASPLVPLADWERPATDQPSSWGDMLSGIGQTISNMRMRPDTPLFDVTAGQSPDGWQVNLGRPGTLVPQSQPVSHEWAGPPEAPAAQQPTQQPLVASASAGVTPPPAAAQPSYMMGDVSVPLFGTAPELSAQSRRAAPQVPAQPNAPGINPLAAGAAGFAANAHTGPIGAIMGGIGAATTANQSPTSRDQWMDFLDRFSPGYVDRYRASKTQADTARQVATVLMQRGMSEGQAASLAVVAARNPKLMEEILKPSSTVEAAIARRMDTGKQTGGLQTLSDLEAAKETGKLDAKSAAERKQLAGELPSFTAQAQEHIRQVEELRAHPGRKGNMWWHGKGSAALSDSTIPGDTDPFDAQQRLNQVKGGAFLEAFKTLKGGGTITEQEGKAATAALARMNRASSAREFDSALDDYTGAIKRGLDKLYSQAGQPTPYGFKGNDGWQTLSPGIRIRERK